MEMDMYVRAQACVCSCMGTIHMHTHVCLQTWVCMRTSRWTHLSVYASVFLSTRVGGGRLGEDRVEDFRRRFPTRTDSWRPWAGRITLGSLRGKVSLCVSTGIFWLDANNPFLVLMTWFPGKGLHWPQLIHALFTTCDLQPLLVWSYNLPHSSRAKISNFRLVGLPRELFGMQSPRLHFQILTQKVWVGVREPAF